ncbi:MAG TPA: hypothetical protein VJB57_00730 [Dehalococcoidia bacterium]|nr:hypothetical protein [Dehalococcoidia bacterium]
MAEILKFEMRAESGRDDVESDLALALFAAECVYGKPRVRMEASYLVAEDGRTCVVSTAGEAGEAAARIFAGLTSARVGEAAYSVKRLAGGHS